MDPYASLGLSAFLAATLLPLHSELLLLALLASGQDPAGLWLAASLGNTLGGALNWLLGRHLLHYQPIFVISAAVLREIGRIFRASKIIKSVKHWITRRPVLEGEM
jgi:membrane protein YqaA with SNARE-associated domain